MGCGQSKEDDLLDKVLIDAVRAAKVKVHKKPGKLNELLLKLPRVNRGYKEMKQIFHKLDAANAGSINAKILQDNATAIGFTAQDASLARVLSDTGLAQASSIGLNDFVALLTVVHLRFPDGHMMKVHPDIGATFSILEEFFVCLDVTKDGTLERKEIERSVEAEDAKVAARQFFKQLDWDGNGHISFREFTLGLCQFADDADGDEDEEQ